MKPSEGTMICDRCKIIVAKHKCLGCEEDICHNCCSMFAIELKTSNSNERIVLNSDSLTPPSISRLYGNGYASVNNVMSSKYIICKKCKKAMDTKDAADVIRESEEMKKLIEKIKKTVLSSRMLNGLEDSEIKDEQDGQKNNYNYNINNALYQSSKKNKKYKLAYAGA